MHKVLVNRLGGLSLPRKSVVRLTDRPDMTLDVYRGRKTIIQPTFFSQSQSTVESSNNNHHRDASTNSSSIENKNVGPATYTVYP